MFVQNSYVNRLCCIQEIVVLFFCFSTGALALNSNWVSTVPVTVLTERDVPSHAQLTESPTLYEFNSTLKVAASFQQVNSLLRSYDQLKNWVPYLERSDYDRELKTLKIRGGLWGWILESTLKIREVSEKLLEFEIVQGHLLGLKGKIEMEKAANHPKVASMGAMGVMSSGTLVRISGSRKGGSYPPAWIMERGAEFALSLGGKKLRSEIESKVQEPLVPRRGTENEANYPKPQNHL